MGRLGLILVAASVVCLLLAVLALFLVRARIWLHLQAGGEPLLDVRLGVRVLAFRRERHVLIPGAQGRAMLGRLVREALSGAGSRRTAARQSRQPGRVAAVPAAAKFAPLAGDVIEAVSLDTVDVAVSLGTGDAAGTAVLCGLANAVGGVGLALLSRAEGRPRHASFRVVPRWGDRAGATLRLDCIARPRLSQAIFAAWRVYRAYRPSGPARGTMPGRARGARVPPGRFGPANLTRPSA